MLSIESLGLFVMTDSFGNFHSRPCISGNPVSKMASTCFNKSLQTILYKPFTICFMSLGLSLSTFSHMIVNKIILYNIFLNKIANKKEAKA